MNIGVTAKRSAILALIDLLGHGDLFPRIVSEIHRVNLEMPGATGADKKAKVIADAKIIFDDLIIPLSERTLNLLIEVGLEYLSTKV